MTPATPRKLYCVLSPRSLPYAEHAFRSLFAHCVEPLDLTLITDADEDKVEIARSLSAIGVRERQGWRVASKREADERAQARLAPYPRIRAFREGHPCWRKITDPLLFAAPGEEMVILDPDLYFPNRFAFEPTPATGIALMWQKPHCMLPDETVAAAYDAGLALAHHVDIGVGQWRHPGDLAVLEDILGKLGGHPLPRKMHVEVIVWAALAMRLGGGYLDPKRWSCWRNAQWKRVARRLGVPGTAILACEDFAAMKCFHGGGIAKWWIPDRVAAGAFAPPRRVVVPSPLAPFEPLTRAQYEAGQKRKDVARRLGYYRLLPAEA